MLIQTPSINWLLVLPEVLVAVTALLVLLVDLFVSERQKSILAYLALAGVIAAFIDSLTLVGGHNVTFSGMITSDTFSLFFNCLFLAAVALLLIISPDFIRSQNLEHQGEYYALMLAATEGMMLMAAGTNFMTIFLGLELLSIALYILCAFAQGRFRSQEAGAKYFLLSSFASAFLLYGMSLVYGATGSTSLEEIATHLEGGTSTLLLAGMGLLAIGFAFKVSAVPFHQWTPDVYQGAPTSVTAFMAVGTKAAAFAAFARVFVVTFHTSSIAGRWFGIIWSIALLTMIAGNVIAVAQTNVKRMLAYSSIGHAGYLLLGLAANSETGIAALLFYLLVYTAMNLGAFLVVLAIERRDGEGNNLSDFAGLARRNPLLAGAMALFMFSLAGIPPTGGFIAKFYIFNAIIAAGHLELALVAILCSLISVFYYLRVIVMMYMSDAPERASDVQSIHLGAPLGTVLSITVLATLGLGIFPASLFSWAELARQSVSLLMK